MWCFSFFIYVCYTHTHTYTHTYTYIYTHTYIYIYIYIYTMLHNVKLLNTVIYLYYYKIIIQIACPFKMLAANKSPQVSCCINNCSKYGYHVFVRCGHIVTIALGNLQNWVIPIGICVIGNFVWGQKCRFRSFSSWSVEFTLLTNRPAWFESEFCTSLTLTLELEFSKSSPWQEFSKRFGFSDLVLRLHVDKRSNRIEKAVVLKIPRFVWTGPKICTRGNY